jgi:hypothetical protein
MMVLSQLGPAPGPIDAFQANLAATKVRMDFRLTKGNMKRDSLARGSIWEDQGPAYVPTPGSEVVGTWATDGRCMYHMGGSPDHIRASGKEQAAKETGSYMRIPFTPKTESLFDGETLAMRFLDDKDVGQADTILVARRGDPSFMPTGTGPFSWWNYPFPLYVHELFPGVTPRHSKGVVGGVLVEFEVYSREIRDGRESLEVAYAPSLGYLPRKVRLVTTNLGSAYIVETFVTKTMPCSAGGFVILEWFDTRFMVNDFKSRYSSCSETTTILPSFQEVAARHFSATIADESDGPVTFTQLDGVDTVRAIGGAAAVRPGSRDISILDIKRLLGRRLTDQARIPLPAIDTAEIHEHDPKRAYYWAVLMALAAIGIVVLAVRAALRSRGASASGMLLLSLFCSGSAGCGQAGAPLTKLSAEIENPTFLFHGRLEPIPLTLLITNQGNQALKIFGIDGGCSCRKVDKSALPRELRPGDTIRIPLSYTPRRSSQPQAADFEFQTNVGNLRIGTQIYPLPRSQVEPESLSLQIQDGDAPAARTFDLTHRQIDRVSDPQPSLKLIYPPEISVEKVTTLTGLISGATEYRFTDTIYRITLKAERFGLHKSVIEFVDPKGATLAETSLVWNRLPFLSSVPDRVVLGKAPVRAYLRCRDEAIELVRVVSAPNGVKAVVTSPRQVTVSLDPNHASVIDGSIAVETTAEGQAPLAIPVVHYGPY